MFRKIISTILVVFLVSGCGLLPENEVSFAKRVFTGLVNGRQAVARDVDWNNFKAIGVDVGTAYIKLPTDKAKANYRRILISSLSFGFKQTGAKASLFKNWRVYTRDNDKVTVAADTGSMTLLFYLSVNGRNKKLVGMEWLKEN